MQEQIYGSKLRVEGQGRGTDASRRPRLGQGAFDELGKPLSRDVVSEVEVRQLIADDRQALLPHRLGFLGKRVVKPLQFLR